MHVRIHNIGYNGRNSKLNIKDIYYCIDLNWLGVFMIQYLWIDFCTVINCCKVSFRYVFFAFYMLN